MEMSPPPPQPPLLPQCSYIVDVEVHIPWAPDVEVRQTLTIRPPANTAVSVLWHGTVSYPSPPPKWSDWRPPGWITSCKPTQVLSPCAVPSDITSNNLGMGWGWVKLHGMGWRHIWGAGATWNGLETHLGGGATWNGLETHIFPLTTGSDTFSGMPGFQPLL